jgi:hypothetical protein
MSEMINRSCEAQTWGGKSAACVVNNIESGWQIDGDIRTTDKGYLTPIKG